MTYLTESDVWVLVAFAVACAIVGFVAWMLIQQARGK